jgi:hypothetical protein
MVSHAIAICLPADRLSPDSLFKQSSGVTVSAEAKTVYEEVKKDKKYRYIIYHIKDEKVSYRCL